MGATTDLSVGAIVRRLRQEYGFTEDDLTRATGAGRRTVARWAANGNGQKRTSKNEERLDDLRVVAAILIAAYPGHVIRQWMRARNRLLDWHRPLDLLGEGRFEEVRRAAEAFVDGDYV